MTVSKRNKKRKKLKNTESKNGNQNRKFCLVIEDAKKDFVQDQDFVINKDNKKAFNVAKDITKILKEYLTKN